jgi:hypothetical protein
MNQSREAHGSARPLHSPEGQSAASCDRNSWLVRSLETLFDCSPNAERTGMRAYAMRSEMGPKSDDDAAVARALRSDRADSRCACCGLPAHQPVCAQCADHVEIDTGDEEAVTRRETNHRDRWMRAFTVARRHSLKDKEQVAAALRSRDRYRDALRQLWQWHEPKPNAVDPRHCSCGSRWPCRTAQLVDRVVGEWASAQERDELLREEQLDREYQRSLNPPPSDLRPYRPRMR